MKLTNIIDNVNKEEFFLLNIKEEKNKYKINVLKCHYKEQTDGIVEAARTPDTVGSGTGSVIFYFYKGNELIYGTIGKDKLFNTVTGTFNKDINHASLFFNNHYKNIFGKQAPAIERQIANILSKDKLTIDDKSEMMNILRRNESPLSGIFESLAKYRGRISPDKKVISFWKELGIDEKLDAGFIKSLIKLYDKNLIKDDTRVYANYGKFLGEVNDFLKPKETYAKFKFNKADYKNDTSVIDAVRRRLFPGVV